MKQFIIFVSALFFCANINSQVYVNESGQVGVGSSLIGSSSLFVKNDSNNYGINITGYSLHSDLRVISSFNNNSNNTSKYGIYVQSVLNNNHTYYGLLVSSMGTSDMKHIGMKAVGGSAQSFSSGVVGGLNGSNVQFGAGIFGSANSTISVPSNHAGKYAGYFKGDVRVTGTLYANVLTPSAASSSPDSQNDASSTIQVVSRDVDEEGASVSDKLRQVQLLRIQNIERTSSANDSGLSGNSSKPTEIEAIEQTLQAGEELTAEQLETLEAYEDVSAANDEVPQTRMSSVRYSLAADQLQSVYPELVYEDQNGNVSINYIEMIPLLVQSINELQERIEVLEEENASLRNPNSHSPSRKKGRITDNVITDGGTEIISLGQNVPNPFTDRTAIAVNLPKSVSNATLFIYDMSGKQIEKIQITDRGRSSVSVYGTNLQEGMYLYSLIADGKVIDTRKMILTK